MDPVPTTTSMPAERCHWIDAARSLACLCVLVVHAYVPGGTRGAGLVGVINYFAVAGASILFFMISGALVLYKPKPFFPFMKRRLLRIALPMVIWTVIALLLGCLTPYGGGMTWHHLPQALALIPFAPQFGTFWFIYVVFGIYLLAPVVATWLQQCRRRELEALLAVGAVAVLLPLSYFAFKIPPRLFTNRLAINVVLLCCCYFVAIKHLKLGPRMQRLAYNFASHSFGIYLIHKLLMQFVVLPLAPEHFSTHYALVYPLVVAMLVVVCYSVVHLLSKLPGSKYFIGI